MPDIEVLAVEIKQFRGKSTQTLVPRVIGRSASPSAAGSHPKLTPESFLDGFDNAEAWVVADRLLDVAQKSGSKLDGDLAVSAFEWAVQFGRNPSPLLGYICRRKRMGAHQGFHFRGSYIRREPSAWRKTTVATRTVDRSILQR